MELAGINPLYLIAGLALLGLAPFLLMMVTSYVKIVVVTSLVRNALGVQQVPPAMVMNGLAIILTVFIMAPVAMDTKTLLEEQRFSANPKPSEMLETLQAVSPPLRQFLEKTPAPPFCRNSWARPSASGRSISGRASRVTTCSSWCRPLPSRS